MGLNLKGLLRKKRTLFYNFLHSLSKNIKHIDFIDASEPFFAENKETRPIGFNMIFRVVLKKNELSQDQKATPIAMVLKGFTFIEFGDKLRAEILLFSPQSIRNYKYQFKESDFYLHFMYF